MWTNYQKAEWIWESNGFEKLVCIFNPDTNLKCGLKKMRTYFLIWTKNRFKKYNVERILNL
jgi:hypothetical protein